MTAANGAAAAIAALVAVWQGTQGQETPPDARRSPLTGAGVGDGGTEVEAP